MLNMNFEQRVVIATDRQKWQPSPAKGVCRKPLERAAEESGHVTSIVRYTPGSRFPSHRHPLGEEILVLDGTFCDETGQFPAGSYLRNPPGSQHAPFSQQGCVLFVKLNQFDPRDNQQLRINTHEASWLPGQGRLQVMPLHAFEHEHVALVKWPQGEQFPSHKHFGGEEILVLSGTFSDEHGHYPIHCWMRNPHLSQHTPYTEEDTLIWVKTGHLPLLL